ncbi:NUDIX domain-containing protein [Hephaestia sp. GCM10023244]|uniref:NUDIX hydrolase n=1 Tax=unclassified Hephaestia TaxID=2631281 RepID=UPI00207707E9|nr:NUDIX domain-containing protein [Hephaestia sp. MAHUQ-44]MCM8731686.1 NUDIX domain-containing protein [Hephaestia sp. MAHUQ-44]
MAERLPDPIPAATLILFRETDAGPPDILFVERARTMAFAGGAIVFPGGRIDPGDDALARTLGGDTGETAARVAAIRETIEEAGIAVGLDRLPDSATLGRLRTALHAGRPFAELLAHERLAIDPDALAPFARWCPQHAHARIFDTRFYLARLPDGAPDPVVDNTENVRVFWRTATDMLDDVARGTARAIFPTRRNLERLATFGSFAEAVAGARAFPVRTVAPWTETRDGGTYLCIPDDLGYPITAEPLATAIRD